MAYKLSEERIFYNSEKYYIKEANTSERAELHEMFKKFVAKGWVPSPGENLAMVVIDKETRKIIGGMERNIDAENRKAIGRGLVVLPEFQEKGIGTILIKTMDNQLKEDGIIYVETLPTRDSFKLLMENGYDWVQPVKEWIKEAGISKDKFHNNTMEKYL
jgi:GNAT superfamily N-acetyltransferase